MKKRTGYHTYFYSSLQPGGLLHAVQVSQPAVFTRACKKHSFADSELSDKMKALLTIAGAVQASGKNVTPHMVETARAAGASDKEVHDTVLIAAAFCMFNRYVDGYTFPLRR